MMDITSSTLDHSGMRFAAIGLHEGGCISQLLQWDRIPSATKDVLTLCLSVQYNVLIGNLQRTSANRHNMTTWLTARSETKVRSPNRRTLYINQSSPASET
jgi:hypothetical protein